MVPSEQFMYHIGFLPLNLFFFSPFYRLNIKMTKLDRMFESEPHKNRIGFFCKLFYIFLEYW
jgi:hypothetical protein